MKDKSAAINNATFTSAMSEASNYNAWIVSRFHPYFGQSVLEVGIGHGGFYSLLPPLQRYAGIDIDENLVSHAQRLNPEQHYYKGDITRPDLGAILGGQTFDSVLCVNVLEHIKEDEQAVANLLQALNLGGHLLLFVPAFQFLYNDMDRLAGHYRRYTRRSLTTLFKPLQNAIVVKCEYFNPIGGLGWWANKWMRHSSLENNALKGQIKFFDKVILPLSRTFDPLSRRFFGQSLIAVVRKK